MSEATRPRSAAEEAVFGARRGASSWALAAALQVGGVVALLGLARTQRPPHLRPMTTTMVEFSAPPPRRAETPPPPPPAPVPAPTPRPRARATPRPQPAPAPAPPPVAHEAPPVMTSGRSGRGGERVATGNNADFHGGPVQQGAQGNAPEARPEPPPAPPAPPRGPIQLPEDGVAPEALEGNATPEYPAEARAQGVEATIIVTLVIDESGRVTRVIVRRGHPLFDDAVRATLAAWRYRPARVAGEAVEVYWNVRVPFRLEER